MLPNVFRPTPSDPIHRTPNRGTTACLSKEKNRRRADCAHGGISDERQHRGPRDESLGIRSHLRWRRFRPSAAAGAHRGTDTRGGAHGGPDNVASILALTCRDPAAAATLPRRLPHRPAKYVLALNEGHRFHHPKGTGVGDVAFGLFTLIWDHRMRTYSYDPARRFDSI